MYDAGDLVVSCDVADYSYPAVAIATLPQNAAVIAASLVSYLLQGGTPTRPALAGVVEYAKASLAGRPSHRTIIVVATDGVPNDCDSTVDAVSQIAADAAALLPIIPTTDTLPHVRRLPERTKMSGTTRNTSSAATGAESP